MKVTRQNLPKIFAASFEDEIVFQGANSIAAFIMEPIQGAGGVNCT